MAQSTRITMPTTSTANKVMHSIRPQTAVALRFLCALCVAFVLLAVTSSVSDPTVFVACVSSAIVTDQLKTVLSHMGTDRAPRLMNAVIRSDETSLRAAPNRLISRVKIAGRAQGTLMRNQHRLT